MVDKEHNLHDGEREDIVSTWGLHCINLACVKKKYILFTEKANRELKANWLPIQRRVICLNSKEIREVISELSVVFKSVIFILILGRPQP